MTQVTIFAFVSLLLGAGILMILLSAKKKMEREREDMVSAVTVRQAAAGVHRHEDCSEDNPCCEDPAPFDPRYDEIDTGIPDPIEELQDPTVGQDRKRVLMERLSALGYSFAGDNEDAHDEGIIGHRAPVSTNSEVHMD